MLYGLDKIGNPNNKRERKERRGIWGARCVLQDVLATGWLFAFSLKWNKIWRNV